MSMSNVIPLRPRSTSLSGGQLTWSQFKRQIAEWHRRARSRRELMHLGEAGLHDIGLTRCDAAREVAKPFWTP